MARIIFEDKKEFMQYMEKFSGTERMMLLDVKQTNSLILRPLVTSRIDTAVIFNLSVADRQDVKNNFTGPKFRVSAFLGEDEKGRK